MKMCKIETKVHNNSGLYGMCGLNLLVLYSAVEFFFFQTIFRLPVISLIRYDSVLIAVFQKLQRS